MPGPEPGATTGEPGWAVTGLRFEYEDYKKAVKERGREGDGFALERARTGLEGVRSKKMPSRNSCSTTYATPRHAVSDSYYCIRVTRVKRSFTKKRKLPGWELPPHGAIQVPEAIE